MHASFVRICSQSILKNASYVRHLAPNSKIVACVKANAYGHGAVFVAKTLQDCVESFAVARVHEALQLRDAGIDNPIIVLNGALDKAEMTEITRYNLWPVVYDSWQIECILEMQDRPKKVWVKHNSGMCRLGFSTTKFRESISALEEQNISVVAMSHFAGADGDGILPHMQISHFNEACTDLKLDKSMANSAAILHLKESHMQWVRPGLMLYGVEPFLNKKDKVLCPAMHFYAHILCDYEVETGASIGYGSAWTAKRHTRIAIVAAGYADGYSCHMLNNSSVYIADQYAPVIGKVSMDTMAIDITDIEGYSVDCVVELWGKHIAVEKLAADNDLLSYDLLCRVGNRSHWSFD